MNFYFECEWCDVNGAGQLIRDSLATSEFRHRIELYDASTKEIHI